MKKLIAFAFVGLLAVSCSKKDENNVQDSNVMLEEPKAEIVGQPTASAVDASVESTATDAAAPVEAPAAPADSTATK